MNSFTTVIAAVSTPPGKGGVAIIRISGMGAIDIASKVFYPKSKKPLAENPSRVAVYGSIISEGREIDDGMATCFRAPASYTGEDTVEISCHGGMLVTRMVLEAVLAAGARAAEAGEFTKRAFINGKISLSEAEAVGVILEAETRDQVMLSAGRSREIFASKIFEIREELKSTLSSIYARIDYPDEDLGDFTNAETVAILTSAKEKIKALLSTYRTGKSVNEGVKTVICGKPNVGKSTVYNLILREDAAIVTDIKGTTRDVLKEKTSLGRVLLTLLDTAGVRDGEGIDAVEKIGIQRSRDAISEAELILAVFDGSSEFDEEDEAIIEETKKSSATRIALINKSDKEKKLDTKKIQNSFDTVICISAKSDDDSSYKKIEEVVNRLFTDEKIRIGDDAIVASARQNASLMGALECVNSAIEGYELGLSTDMASSDIERALGILAELDGKAISDEVVSDIFAKFCVGK